MAKKMTKADKAKLGKQFGSEAKVVTKPKRKRQRANGTKK